MRLLLDTHVLLWAASDPQRLGSAVHKMIEDPQNQPWFSVASLWEIVIKSGQGRADFRVDAGLLRRGLLDHGWEELSVAADHVLAVAQLPALHRDPFDRLLVAQALAEGMALITADSALLAYPGTIIRA